MTVAEHYIQQEVEHGVQQGVLLVAKNMLRDCKPLNEIAYYTVLSQEVIETLREKCLAESG